MGSDTLSLVTQSVEETVAWGRRLGELLKVQDVIALEGELGAGKTYFVKGIASGLGVSDTREVRSPTFILVSEYTGRIRLYHVDAYRLGGAEELEALGARDFVFGDGVTVVEWADRVTECLGTERLTVRLEHVDAGRRRLSFSACGTRAAELLQQLRAVAPHDGK